MMTTYSCLGIGTFAWHTKGRNNNDIGHMVSGQSDSPDGKPDQKEKGLEKTRDGILLNSVVILSITCSIRKLHRQTQHRRSFR